MTINEIVAAWLKAHGFDGLFGHYGCACHLDDLMPCGEPGERCEAGYQVPCDGTCDAGRDVKRFLDILVYCVIGLAIFAVAMWLLIWSIQEGTPQYQYNTHHDFEEPR